MYIYSPILSSVIRLVSLTFSWKRYPLDFFNRYICYSQCVKPYSFFFFLSFVCVRTCAENFDIAGNVLLTQKKLIFPNVYAHLVPHCWYTFPMAHVILFSLDWWANKTWELLIFDLSPSYGMEINMVGLMRKKLG